MELLYFLTAGTAAILAIGSVLLWQRVGRIEREMKAHLFDLEMSVKRLENQIEKIDL